MYSFWITANKLVTLLVYLATGHILRRSRAIDDGFLSGVSRFLMAVCLPALTITTFQVSFSAALLFEGLKITAACLAVCIACGFIAKMAGQKLRLGSAAQGVWIFNLMFPNTVLFGWPIINAVYGSEGMFYAMFVNLAVSGLVYTAGVLIMKKYGGKSTGTGIKETILTPLNIALFGSLLMFVLQIRIPPILSEPLSGLGGITTPLAMVYCGAQLGRYRLKELRGDWRINVISVFRLVFMPLLMLSLCKVFSVPELQRAVIVISFSAPTPGLCPVYAGEYGGDVIFASKCMVTTTVLSIFTIPLFLIILAV